MRCIRQQQAHHSFCYHTRPVFEMALPLLNLKKKKTLQDQFCTWKLSTVCLSRCASKRVQNWDLYLVSSWGFYSLKQIWTLLNPIFPQKMFIHFPTSPWLLYIQIVDCLNAYLPSFWTSLLPSLTEATVPPWTESFSLSINECVGTLTLKFLSRFQPCISAPSLSLLLLWYVTW